MATVGPASEAPEVLAAMIGAGMTAARISLSHGSLDEALARLARLRRVAAEAGTHTGVLADLPGPKVRTCPFPEDGARLLGGAPVDLVVGDEADPSTAGTIAVAHPGVVETLAPGDRVLLGDGGIELLVVAEGSRRARCEVVSGGLATGRPGLALPPGRVELSSPTHEDLRLLEVLAEHDVDAVAISFVRSGADIDRARDHVGPGGPMLVAKIETQEAVDALEEIVATGDAVMVARGDLGLRCRLEDVPHHQKRIIRTGVAYGRQVITATQMLESMVRSPTPTRAEVSDVANAVFDGTSALMLSGETAVGRDPVAAVATMARVAARAEREFDYEGWGRSVGRQQHAEARGYPMPQRITSAISAAAWRATNDADVAAIIACTEGGSTPRAISRFRPTVPLLAATPSPRTARQLSMGWGIEAVVVDRQSTTDDIVWFAVAAAAERGVVRTGDLVAVLVGSPAEPEPATDTLRLVRVR